MQIDGNQVTVDPGGDLNPGSAYSVRIDAGAFIDAAGNDYAGISDDVTLNFDTAAAVDTTIVVFDLVQGVSSDHSGRRFDENVSYDIYVIVDSDSSVLSTAGDGPGTWGRWRGADGLGSDDRIILVGDDGAVQGRGGVVGQMAVAGDQIDWETVPFSRDAVVIEGRSILRITGTFLPVSSSVRLFDQSLDGDFFDGQGGNLATQYLTDLPGGILTSQGLV